MPLEKGPSDKDVDREKGKDRMSTTLDKPRVTFDSSSNFSKSEFDSKPVQSNKHANDDDDDDDDDDDEVYRDSLNISPRRSRGGWGDIDKKNSRKQSMSDKYDDGDDDGADTNVIQNDFKRSSAWSTMETQLRYAINAFIILDGEQLILMLKYFFVVQCQRILWDSQL